MAGYRGIIVLTGTPGNYSLSQNIVDLAKAVNFDTTNFKLDGNDLGVIGC